MVKKAFNIQNIILLLLFQLLFIPVSHAEQVVVTSGRVEYDPFGRVGGRQRRPDTDRV